MEMIKRLDILKAMLATASGQIKERTRLHRLAYLCQIAGDDLGYSFAYHPYSVFSPALDFDIDRAIHWGSIKEEYGPDNEVITCLCEAQFSSVGQGHGLALVRQLAHEPSAVLELLSTIVYLNEAGYSDEELERRLEELKAHLHDCEEPAWFLAEKHFKISRNARISAV